MDYDSSACSYCTEEDSLGDLGYAQTNFPEVYEDDTTQLGA